MLNKCALLGVFAIIKTVVLESHFTSMWHLNLGLKNSWNMVDKMNIHFYSELNLWEELQN